MAAFYPFEDTYVSEPLRSAFATSPVGLLLFTPFPPGSLHRDRFSDLERWQQRFAPTVKRRTPKKRKRKH